MYVKKTVIDRKLIAFMLRIFINNPIPQQNITTEDSRV